MSQVVLAPLRWWHLSAVARVEAEVFPDTAWSQEAFWGELAHVPATRRYLVALADRPGGEPEVVGYAGLAAVPPESDVQTIAVAPEAQGAGVGRALLEALVEESARRGCTTLLLEVAADNARAIDLYERRGFERIAVRPAYYGAGRDAVVMRLRVGGGR